jgi:hypothetical protein
MQLAVLQSVRSLVAVVDTTAVMDRRMTEKIKNINSEKEEREHG